MSQHKIQTWRERMPEPRRELRCAMNCYPCTNACGDCAPVTIHGDPIRARDEELAALRSRVEELEAEARRYREVRTWAPVAFSAAWQRALTENTPFDDIVDSNIRAKGDHHG